MKYLFYFIATVIATIIILIINKISPSADKANKKTDSIKIIEYNARPILTKNEWNNYLEIRKYANEHNLIICPKIRLADLVEPIRGTRSEWQIRFNRIKAKHVDFVLCDPNMQVKVIIELDDNSHNKTDRIKRDKFVDATLVGAGYNIIHIQKFDINEKIALNSILKPNEEERVEVLLIDKENSPPTERKEGTEK